MSYEKVRSVRFLSDDNIILESVSNNVSPKKYHKWKFTGTLIDFLRYVQGSELQIITRRLKCKTLNIQTFIP